MDKVDDYARALGGLDDPEPHLLEHSGLPGPRGNIELGLAAARVCDAVALRRWAALDAQAAPTGGAGEFLAFCGVIGLGRLLAEGDASALGELRTHANDSRWRVREAVAMALQRWGAPPSRPRWHTRRRAATATCAGSPARTCASAASSASTPAGWQRSAPGWTESPLPRARLGALDRLPVGDQQLTPLGILHRRCFHGSPAAAGSA